MIKQFVVVDGDKADYVYSGHEFAFVCDEQDIDLAYDVLAESLNLVSEDDLIDFQNAQDDDVPALLDDMKRMGFIDQWEAWEVE